MNPQRTWTAPTLRELNLSLEVGMYFEDDEFPIDVPRTAQALPLPTVAGQTCNKQPAPPTNEH